MARVRNFKQVNSNILIKMPSPSGKAYELRHTTHELTFLGKPAQPDFAKILIVFYPKKWTIELKSLKEYLSQFRDITISYERLVNVIYDDLMENFKPARLRIELWCKPRGGISTHAIIDSDWPIRGGKDRFWKYEKLQDREEID